MLISRLIVAETNSVVPLKVNELVDAVNGGSGASSPYFYLTGTAFTGAFSAVGSGYKIISLASTGFTSVDVHNSTSLTSLSIDGSASVASLNVAGCTSLTTVDATGATALATFSFTGDTALETLTFVNCTSLTAISFAGFTTLTTANFTGATGVTTVSFAGCTGLTTATFTGATSVTTVSFAGCTYLTSLTLASATTLNLSGCTALTTFDPTGTIHNITSANFDDCTSLTSIVIKSDNLATITAANCTAVTEFQISNAALDGPCLVTSVDLSTLTALSGLDIYAPLTSIDLTANTNMTGILVEYAAFTSIDLTSQPLATTIDLNNCANLATITLASVSEINDFEAPGCALPTSQVNSILVALAANSISFGFCDLSGQTPAAPPSGAGAAAVTTLQGRGWTVNTD